MISLGKFGDPRVGEQLTNSLDIEVEFETQGYAFGQTAAHRLAHRQIDPRVQMVDASLEIEVSRADLEAALQAVGTRRAGAQRPAERGDGNQQSRAGPCCCSASPPPTFPWRGIHCIIAFIA